MCTTHVELVLESGTSMPFFSGVLKISPDLSIMLQSMIAPLYPASGIGYALFKHLLSSPSHTLSLKKSIFREILFHRCVYVFFYLFQKLAVALPWL
jgi:hypothetical protein